MPARPQCNRRPLAPLSPGRAPPAPIPSLPRAPSLTAICRGLSLGTTVMSESESESCPSSMSPASSAIFRGAQGQESASGGRREGLRAVLRRPRAGGPAAPLQARASVTITKLTAGRRVRRTLAVSPRKVRPRSGFRSDLPLLTRMLRTGLPAAFFFCFCFFSASTFALRQAGLSPMTLLTVLYGHWPACVLGLRLLQPLFLRHP